MTDFVINAILYHLFCGRLSKAAVIYEHYTDVKDIVWYFVFLIDDINVSGDCFVINWRKRKKGSNILSAVAFNETRNHSTRQEILQRCS